MKTLSRISLGALLAACCASTALAQGPCNPDAPKTRAQVHADLVQWRAAGYDPLDWIDYPQNAQQAAQIVAQQREAAGNPGGCAP